MDDESLKYSRHSWDFKLSLGLPDSIHRDNNPLAFASILPLRISDVTSWQGLTPIAFFLVAAHRPRIFVELGTHKGDSYCAFCQAVLTNQLHTKCFAVDTWQGDEHAGHYGAEILAELRGHHDPLYGSFSRLVHSTFDEALTHFGDGAIDLLHIDGLHTYEAVKHDFESWHSKLSDRALVLFHDINVREHGFEVWRFWEEISAQYPHVEFSFSNGLGIAGIGTNLPTAIRDLFDANPNDFHMIESLLFALGDRVVLTGTTARLSSKLASYERQLEELQNRFSQQEAQTRTLSNALSLCDTRIDSLNQELAGAARKLCAIMSSRSWRLTAPLRAIREILYRTFVSFE